MFLIHAIGVIKELSILLEIKAVVVAAGLFRQLRHQKVPTLFILVIYFNFQNKILLIVLHFLDAEEDGLMMLANL